MHRIIISIIAVMLIPASASGTSPTDEQRLDAGGIVKTIEIPSGSKWAYINVQAIIDAPPKKVWNTLADIEGWPKWLPMNERAWLISETAEKKITPEIARDKAKVLEIGEKYPRGKEGEPLPEKEKRQMTAIEEYNLPWPIENQWVIRRYSFDESKEPYRATWQKIDADDDNDDGAWEIRKWRGNYKSHLRYYYRMKVKKGVPKPLYKAAITLTVHSMIKSLHREVKK